MIGYAVCDAAMTPHTSGTTLDAQVRMDRWPCQALCTDGHRLRSRRTADSCAAAVLCLVRMRHRWRHGVLIVSRFHGSLSVQARYQKGIQTMLEQWFKGEQFEESNYIVREGELAPQYQ